MRILNIVFLLTAVSIFSQTVKIENINEFDISYSGSVKKEGVTNYYTFFVNNEDVGGKNKEGVLAFYNNNLELINEQKFLLNNKTNRLIEVKNNGVNVAVSLYNKTTSNLTYKFYSFNGEKLDHEYVLPYKKQTFTMDYYKEIQKMGEWILNYPVEDNGFLFTETIKKKKWGYKITFVDNEGKSWEYDSPADFGKRVQASPIYANEEKIVLVEKIWASNFDRQPEIKVVVLNTKTGKEDFSVNHDYEKKPKFYTKAYSTTEGNIVLFGEFYKNGHRFHNNDYNDGFFIEMYSSSGELLSKNLFSFNNPELKESLGINSNEKQNDFGSIYFRTIVEKDNRVYVLGERYVRDVQGFTNAMAIVSVAFNTLSQQNWVSKYTLGDIVVFEIDKNSKLINVALLVKDKAPSGLDSMNKWPLMNLRHMEEEFSLDFVDNDKLVIKYKNRKTVKKDKKEELIYSYNISEFNDKTFTKINESVFNVTNEEMYRILEGQSNQFVLLKYNRSKKFCTLEIIK